MVIAPILLALAIGTAMPEGRHGPDPLLVILEEPHHLGCGIVAGCGAGDNPDRGTVEALTHLDNPDRPEATFSLNLPL
jgi:hypothetical protein